LPLSAPDDFLKATEGSVLTSGSRRLERADKWGPDRAVTC